MSKRHSKLVREIVDRYKLIRAIHTCYYTQLDADVGKFATEFYFLVSDVLEGKPIDESRLRYIDMSRVYEFLKEDK